MPSRRSYLQSMADEFHNRFRDIVARGRPEANIDDKTLLDGRVFTASEALNRKLIDTIGYLDDAVEMARQMGHARGAQVVLYHRAQRLGPFALLDDAEHSDRHQHVADQPARLRSIAAPRLSVSLGAGADDGKDLGEITVARGRSQFQALAHLAFLRQQRPDVLSNIAGFFCQRGIRICLYDFFHRGDNCRGGPLSICRLHELAGDGNRRGGSF